MTLSEAGMRSAVCFSSVKLLSEIEIRVLGALVEKELTTPDYYPLSLNALVNACNQKSNRDPAMSLDDDAVRQALRSLEKEGLAGPADSMDNRVTKYEHRLQEAFNFDRREVAVLCELLLRGPQTLGELRGRAERMYKFEDLSQVQSTLQRLAQREPPVAKMLPRQPGTKEARYAQLLSGEPQIEAQPAVQSDAQHHAPTHANEAARERAATHSKADDDRIARLKSDLSALQNELADLKQQFASFRKQFE